jgi:hypothetical protein
VVSVAKEKKEEITTEKARQILIKENQEKQRKCQQEIQAVLDKFGCVLDASMVVTARGNVPQITIAVKQTGS